MRKYSYIEKNQMGQHRYTGARSKFVPVYQITVLIVGFFSLRSIFIRPLVIAIYDGTAIYDATPIVTAIQVVHAHIDGFPVRYILVRYQGLRYDLLYLLNVLVSLGGLQLGWQCQV